jgi:hypothetical protein
LALGYGYLGWPGYPFLWNDPGFYSGYSDYLDNGNYGNAYGAAPGAPYGDTMPSYEGYPEAPGPYNYGTDYGYTPQTEDGSYSSRQPYTGPGTVIDPPARQQALTVIFNDGRPSEQIHNYLLTATTLTVLDQKYHEIPLDQVNVAATQAANRADGIDFSVPPAAR